MDKLKVAFIDFWPHFTIENIFLPILEKNFEVIIDEIKPDVIFHSVFSKNYQKYKCRKILYIAENFRPTQFDTDYTISYDPHTETNYFLPVWQYYMILYPEYKDLLFNRVNLNSFERFCSYIVSNGGNFMRNGIFNTLNNYKKVHSYGKYMTNDFSLIRLSKSGVVNNKELAAGSFWRSEKLKFLRDHTHKFAVAFENAYTPYYNTEKLMDGYLVGSIPIYWGDPRINQDWNEEAFINTKGNLEKTLNIIKHIDNNEYAFNEIYTKPVFTEEQKERHIKNMENFEKWLVKIVKI
jgi:alpha(1,3/1,4) fucosyltransferase